MKLLCPFVLLFLFSPHALAQLHGLVTDPVPHRYGQLGTAAVNRCPPDVAEDLRSFLWAGKLEWLPRPQDALRLIVQHGPRAAVFIMRNADELRDLHAFNALMANPEALIHGHTSLYEAMQPEPEKPSWVQKLDTQTWVVIGAVLLVVLAAAAHKAKRRNAGGHP